jgi:serine/threonine-protein kinase
MPLLAGTRLGPYEVLSAIGAGGMGEVYRAKDTRLDRDVAIKVLPTELSTDAERLSRFEREAKATAALSHPNVLAVYDVGTHEGAPYLVEELLKGESLLDRLRSGAVPVRKAVGIAVQFAHGLAAAHEKHLVHRDLKPANVFLTTDGTVKILDFGLARLAEGVPHEDAETTAGALAGMTQFGRVLGTTAYMAPEQARGLPVDARADIFAFGVVLYEVLAGERPFRGRTVSDTIAAILKDDPPPLPGRVPPALQRIVGQCLEKRPEDRFSSAHDLALALEAASSSIEAVPAGVIRAGAAADSWRFGASVVEGQGRSASSGVRRWRLRAIVGTSVLAVLLAAYYLFNPEDRLDGLLDQPQPTPVKSLAVLPLRAIGNPEGAEYIGLGLADAIITSIGQVGHLTVRPTSAIRKYAEAETDGLAAARQLKVDSVLEGTFQRVGNKIRVNVNLLRMPDGASMWSQSYDLSSTDIFELQDTLSQQVASRLLIKLSSAEASRLTKRYTSSARAHEHYLKGLYAEQKLRAALFSRNDAEAAVASFKKAIDLDPKYALAHAHLALVYSWLGIVAEPGNATWLELCNQSLTQAEALDSQLAETHVVRAELHWSSRMGFDVDSAIRELQLAEQLDPSSGHTELGTIYCHLGLAEPALRELQRALEIDPTSEYPQQRLIECSIFLNRPDEAITAQERFKLPSSRVAVAYIGQNRLDRAQVENDLDLARNPNDPYAQSIQTLLLAARGRYREAEAEIGRMDKAVENSRMYHHVAFHAACVYATQGKVAEALNWLRRTADTGLPDYPLFAGYPLLNRIREDSRFKQFLGEMKGRWDSYRARYP